MKKWVNRLVKGIKKSVQKKMGIINSTEDIENLMGIKVLGALSVEMPN
ncbi:MAG: hypothetical protein ACRC2K_13935 [Clostridium sp.]